MTTFKIKKTKTMFGSTIYKVYQDGVWVGHAKTEALAKSIVSRRKKYKTKAR